MRNKKLKEQLEKSLEEILAHKIWIIENRNQVNKTHYDEVYAYNFGKEETIKKILKLL